MTFQKITPSVPNYKGIKNVAEFEALFNTNSKDRKKETVFNKISKATYTTLRENIVFSKDGVFHGFMKNGNLYNELHGEEIRDFLQALIATPIILEGYKGISNPVGYNERPTWAHIDWTWWSLYGSEYCKPYKDATCITYPSGIVCGSN